MQERRRSIDHRSIVRACQSFAGMKQPRVIKWSQLTSRTTESFSNPHSLHTQQTQFLQTGNGVGVLDSFDTLFSAFCVNQQTGHARGHARKFLQHFACNQRHIAHSTAAGSSGRRRHNVHIQRITGKRRRCGRRTLGHSVWVNGLLDPIADASL